MTQAAEILCNVFSTDAFKPQERWDAWRESISVLFDVRLLDDAAKNLSNASVCAYNLGPVVFGDAHFCAQCFARSDTKIRRDGMDHFMAQLYVEGGFRGHLDDQPIEVRPGDVCLIDLAQPLDTRCLPSRALSLVIHRNLLEDVLPGSAALHGTVLRRESGVGSLLADHFLSLSRCLAQLSGGEGSDVAHATVTMLAACYRPCARLAEAARRPLAAASMNRIKRYVDAHLQSPDLAPDGICKAMGLSRAALYRLFEPTGGVARYIRDQRLNRAYAELTQTSRQHRVLRDVAFDWGFSSEAHFNRLFKRKFGTTPGNARLLAHTRPISNARTAQHWDAAPGCRSYSDWLRELSSGMA